MDPEIERALRDGHSPAEIIAELERRGAPVPPQLREMAAALPPPVAADATATRSMVPEALGVGLAGAGAVASVTKAVRTLRPAGRAARRVGNALKEEGGAEAVLRRLEDFRRAGRGELVTLGDLGPHLRAAADFTATSNEPARAALAEVHAARQAGVPTRLIQDVEQLAGGRVEPGYLRDLIETSQAEFARSPLGYEGLRARNPQLPAPAFAEIINRPRIRRAYEKIDELGYVAPRPDVATASFAKLQSLKEWLDDKAAEAFRAGRGEEGRIFAGARDELVEALSEHIPEYRAVSRTYARFSQEAQWLDDGVKAWDAVDMSVPELELKVKNMTPEQRAAFRRGMLGAYVRDLEQAKVNRNVARELMQRSALTEKKLEVVFGSPQAFREAATRFRLEHEFAKLGEVIGGSQTARRGQALLDPVDVATDVAAAGPHGAVTAAVRRVPGVLAKQTAARMRPWFTLQGAERIEQLVRMLGKLR